MSLGVWCSPSIIVHVYIGPSSGHSRVTLSLYRRAVSRLAARTVQRPGAVNLFHVFEWKCIFVLLMEPTSTHKPLNCTRHLPCGSSVYMREHTLKPEPTSAHKFPKLQQTPTTLVLRPYKGPNLHCRAQKCP